MSYYHGKDNGFFARVNFTLYASPISYFILAKKYRIIFAIIGLVIGGISMPISYLIIINCTNLSDIYYHLLAILFIFLGFFAIERVVLRLCFKVSDNLK